MPPPGATCIRRPVSLSTAGHSWCRCRLAMAKLHRGRTRESALHFGSRPAEIIISVTPMPRRILFALLLALAPALFAAEPPIDRAAMAARVRAELLDSWHAYEKYAWGHDELRPLT